MEEKRQLADKFMLRLPDGMRDRIKAAADENGRSMNAEIVHTLEKKYPAPTTAEMDEFVNYVLSLPEEDRNTLIAESLKRLNVTDEDIEDGLVPGVILKKK